MGAIAGRERTVAETAIQGMTEFEKSLIHAAFMKHVNLAPREIDKLVGVDPAPPAPPALGPEVAAGSPPAAAAPAPPAPPDGPAITEPELLTEEQRIGRDLARIRRAKRETLADADYRQMREAVNFIRRLSGKDPKDADARAEWRAGLMARGFDPDRPAKDGPESE
jgi:hypothetical protein